MGIENVNPFPYGTERFPEDSVKIKETKKAEVLDNDRQKKEAVPDNDKKKKEEGKEAQTGKEFGKGGKFDEIA